MIDFDEELKKFDKSLENGDISEALANADLTDMNDLMFDIIKKNMNTNINTKISM